MAARFSLPEADFCCSICNDVYKNPVLLSCSHSFCKNCLDVWWMDKQVRLCPLCRVPSAGEPHSNLALKNLCESFLLELSLKEEAAAKSEALCSLHSEKLKLYCLDHQQPICVICRDSRTHSNHRFRPIDEAADEYKEELRKHLKPLQEQFKHFVNVKADWSETVEHNRTQAETAEREIRETFKKLRQFLNDEEKARIAALTAEEIKKNMMIQLKISRLSLEIATLSLTIKHIEKELGSGSVTFLQNYNATVEKAKQCPIRKEPTLGLGLLVGVAKHLGNLSFKVWDKMKTLMTYSPVILDPNTAGYNVLMSEDLRSMSFVEQKQAEFLKNPERFEEYPTVLGSEGFNSGTHSWDVHVRSQASWAVGVIGESVSRKGEILSGYWEIWFFEGKYRAFAPPGTDKTLSVQKPLQRIRVNLDWDKGQLSFSDPDTNKTIYTFQQTFTERLFPFINSVDTHPVSILQQKITVRMER